MERVSKFSTIKLGRSSTLTLITPRMVMWQKMEARIKRLLSCICMYHYNICINSINMIGFGINIFLFHGKCHFLGRTSKMVAKRCSLPRWQRAAPRMEDVERGVYLSNPRWETHCSSGAWGLMDPVIPKAGMVRSLNSVDLDDMACFFFKSKVLCGTVQCNEMAWSQPQISFIIRGKPSDKRWQMVSDEVDARPWVQIQSLDTSKTCLRCTSTTLVCRETKMLLNSMSSMCVQDFKCLWSCQLWKIQFKSVLGFLLNFWRASLRVFNFP